MAIQFLNTGNFPDDAKLTFGNSSDLKIYHDAGASTYMENSSGDWYIMQRTDNGNMVFQCDDGDNGDATYFSLDGGSAEHSGAEITALYTKFPDKSRIALGTGKDLQLYHDGTHSYIKAFNTGDLYVQSDNDDVVIQGADDVFIYTQGGEDAIIARGDGAVELYYNNSLKLETTNGGATITGNVSSTTANFADNVYMLGGQLYLGASDGTTDDSFRLYAASGQFVIASRESGTWTTRFDISDSGNATFEGKVGVGITATDQLEVAGNIRANVSNAGGFMLTANSASGLVRESATGLALRTNTTDQLIIDNSGNASFTGTLTIPSYIYHTSDPSDDTYFGFSGNDTFVVYTAGGSGLNIDSNRAVTLTGTLTGTSADFSSTVTIGSITEIGSDTDKFLMSDSGTVKYVSGANLKTYIGASGPDGSGTGNTIAKWSDSDTLTDSSMTDDGSDITATVDGFYIESGDLKIQTSDNTSGKIYLGKTTGTQASSLIDASHSLEIDAATHTGTGQLLLRIDSITKATIASTGVTLNDDTDIEGTLEVTGSTISINNASFPGLYLGSTSSLYKIVKDTGSGNTLEIYSGALAPTIEMSTTGATTFANDVTAGTGFYPDSDGGAEVGNSSLKFSGVYTDLLDAENIKVNGGQGSDGQVLTSTGSGVAWETPSGGGGGSSQWTTSGSNIYYNTGNVGINLSYPKARLHVEGTIKQTSINASEQGFFTSESDPYVKAAGYGKGRFAGASGADNVVQTYAGFTEAGKIVEPRVTRIVKINANSWGSENAGTGAYQVRLTNKVTDGVIIPMSVTVRMNGTSPLDGGGSWGDNNYPIQLIMYGSSSIPGRDKNWSVLGGIPKEMLEDTNNNNRYYKIPFDYCLNNAGYNTDPGDRYWTNSGAGSPGTIGYSNNLALILQGTTDIKNNSSLDDMYVHVEYIPINVNSWDTHFNRATKSQQQGSTTNAVTAFYMSNNQQSGICGSGYAKPANNIKYWHNGRKIYPRVGDRVWRSNTDGTPNLTNAGRAYNGYYYLYSSGGKRYYIRIFGGIGNITISTSCNIPPPTS